MPRRLVKIADMASSTKGPRASSRKKSSADKASVVTVKRADTLPRTVNASASRRKPAMQPESAAPRAKPKRTSARTSRKPPTATEQAAAVTEVPALEAVAAVETEMPVEASQIVEEVALVQAPSPREAPSPRAPHHGARTLVTAVSRLLSTLLRWTGVR
jgi:hypothetical protein